MKNKIQIPNHVETIIGLLERNSFSAYVVGGAVRDSLLDRSIHDWDVCTDASPEDVTRIFADYTVIPTGIKHGTVSIIIEDSTYEVSTFRSDGNYSDNRHPDNVVFIDSIKEDLSRRDFTINAMAYNEKEGLIDPYGGIRDIKNRIVRCVGIPEKRFDEDALRMIRAIRFASQLDFKIDGLTWQAIIDCPYLILEVSNERIQQELNKILLSDYPEHIKTIHSSGMLYPILPSLSDCFGFDQKNPNHIYDVGMHMIETVRHTPKKLYLRLTALLHDIGKPQTLTIDDKGIGHFPRHEDVAMDLAENILKVLRYDNDTIAKVKILIKSHMYSIPASKKSMRKLLNKIGINMIEDWFIIKDADAKARHPKNYEAINSKILIAKNILQEVLQEEECFSLKDLAINGDDLKVIGYKQGKIIGQILEDCLSQVIDNEDRNNKEYLMEYVNQIKR